MVSSSVYLCTTNSGTSKTVKKVIHDSMAEPLSISQDLALGVLKLCLAFIALAIKPKLDRFPPLSTLSPFCCISDLI